MTGFNPLPVGSNRFRALLLLALVSALSACTPPELEPSASPGAGLPEVIDSGDIVIAGQSFAHSIVALAPVAEAPKPPLVQFSGVTSRVTGGPLDPEPYTDLLRDRLLIGCRFKLVFVERQLPPLTFGKKKKAASVDPSAAAPDYRVLADLLGNAGDGQLFVQLDFQNAHTNEVLFHGLYRIRREAAPPPPEPALNPGGSASGAVPGYPPAAPAPPPPPPSGTGGIPGL